MYKRLLLISSNSSSRGGGERYLVYLTQALHLLDCEVQVLISTQSYMDNWAEDFKAEGAIVHRRNLLGLSSRPLRFLQSIFDKQQQREIAKFCQEINPDAILINQQYDEDGLDYVAGALMSQVAPVGGTMHMPMTANKDKRAFGKIRGKLLHRWYEQHAYSLILVSKGSQKEFENYYRYPRPTQVVHHGCQFSDIIASHPPLPENWIEPLPIIGFSGQFVGQKNLQLLIDAWLWSIQQGIQSRLLLIGDGPERNKLETHLHQHAPDNRWHITGWQEHSERYLPVLDIYAMTSHFEGLPLALIEAVGRGIPAVVTHFNGALDVAEHASWVSIAAHANPKSVGQAFIQSINQLPWLKQQARDGKQDFQKYFSLERMAQDTLAALNLT
jgi:glycosyltransferase involved in cell wall biosynthesis